MSAAWCPAASREPPPRSSRRACASPASASCAAAWRSRRPPTCCSRTSVSPRSAAETCRRWSALARSRSGVWPACWSVGGSRPRGRRWRRSWTGPRPACARRFAGCPTGSTRTRPISTTPATGPSRCRSGSDSPSTAIPWPPTSAAARRRSPARPTWDPQPRRPRCSPCPRRCWIRRGRSTRARCGRCR